MCFRQSETISDCLFYFTYKSLISIKHTKIAFVKLKISHVLLPDEKRQKNVKSYPAERMPERWVEVTLVLRI